MAPSFPSVARPRLPIPLATAPQPSQCSSLATWRRADLNGVVVAAAPTAVRDLPAVWPPPVAEHPAGKLSRPAAGERTGRRGPSQQARRRSAPAELAVHLLGPFCAAVDDVPVGDW